MLLVLMLLLVLVVLLVVLVVVLVLLLFEFLGVCEDNWVVVLCGVFG